MMHWVSNSMKSGVQASKRATDRSASSLEALPVSIPMKVFALRVRRDCIQDGQVCGLGLSLTHTLHSPKENSSPSETGPYRTNFQKD